MFARYARPGVRSLAAVAMCALAACAGHSGLLPQQAAPLAAPPFAAPAAAPVPPKCAGQKTTAKYAKSTQKLSNKGGSLCIPAFGGFGGTILYPSANPSVSMTLIGSTTNYAKLANLGKGTPIFYLQLAISSGTAFGTKVVAGGGLASKKIVAGKPYTAYGQASLGAVKVTFHPCYAVATKSPYGGAVGGLGTLLKGQSVPFAVKGFLEIYPGKLSSTKC